MSINLENINAADIQQSIEENATWLQEAQEREQQQNQLEQEGAAADAQAVAEQADPREKERWGIDGVVKELQSAFVGGTQDTASSVVTLGERALDMATGEMQEEMKDGGKYTAEWDDWFVDDSNPIETKTWWG